jgi:hypothetical protein
LCLSKRDQLKLTSPKLSNLLYDIS